LFYRRHFVGASLGITFTNHLLIARTVFAAIGDNLLSM
jgi:hypothetical protein